MSTERNKIISIVGADEESTTVAFLAKDEATVRRQAHSFYKTVFDKPNKGLSAPDLPDDIQSDDF